MLFLLLHGMFLRVLFHGATKRPNQSGLEPLTLHQTVAAESKLAVSYRVHGCVIRSSPTIYYVNSQKRKVRKVLKLSTTATESQLFESMRQKLPVWVWAGRPLSSLECRPVVSSVVSGIIFFACELLILRRLGVSFWKPSKHYNDTELNKTCAGFQMTAFSAQLARAIMSGCWLSLVLLGVVSTFG